MTGPALAAVLACALAIRLAWAWYDVELLLRFATPDDAYYYLQIARNLATGAPASLDGETPTNGFHPLWLAVAVVPQWLFSDPLGALRATLILGALLGTASTGLTYLVVRRLTESTPAALFAAGVVALHPAFVLESVNGLETAAAVFTTALATLGFLALAGNAQPSVRRGILFGLAGGALLLARTDAVFLWGCLLVALLVGAATPRARALPFLAGSVSVACVAPWLAWNALRFGTIVQVSGVALPEPLRADYLAAHGNTLSAAIGRGAFLVEQAFLTQLPRRYLVPDELPAWLGSVALVAIAAGMLRFGTPRIRRALYLLLPPATGIAFGLFWHAGIRWWTREWYFAPAGWLLAVFVGVVAAWIHERVAAQPPPRRRALSRLAGTGALAFLAFLAFSGSLWRVASDHRVQQYEAARWLDANTPPEARIGSFNAGIVSYFSDRTVVNLDGAVNAQAYAARREGRLADYVLATQIAYLVDWRGTLPMAGCGPPTSLRCDRVAVVGEPLSRFAGSPVWVLRTRASSP